MTLMRSFVLGAIVCCGLLYPAGAMAANQKNTHLRKPPKNKKLKKPPKPSRPKVRHVN
jgi:hypothetical protein